MTTPTTPTSNQYPTIRDWHRSLIGGTGMILRRTSAMEHLQYFAGYWHGRNIDVYARERGQYENINYHVVDCFEGIDFVRMGNVLCTSFSQTVNDMLADLDIIDEQPLVEGLARFYYSNGKSFDGLYIRPENMERFNSVRDWAVEYFND